MIYVLLLLITFLMIACESERFVPGYGYAPCVGIGERQDTRFAYKLSAWNAAMGILFVETIVVPVVILVNETFCLQP